MYIDFTCRKTGHALQNQYKIVIISQLHLLPTESHKPKSSPILADICTYVATYLLYRDITFYKFNALDTCTNIMVLIYVPKMIKVLWYKSFVVFMDFQ